jgi:lysophospholipase L1-like esterase
MKDGIANDGLHPNAEGYKIMALIASTAIDRVVK